MWHWLRSLLRPRRPSPTQPARSGRPATPPMVRAARAAQTTGEVVVRTLRLQQLADEWRRRPSNA